VCSKKFRNKNDLKRHFRSCRNQRPLSHDICKFIMIHVH